MDLDKLQRKLTSVARLNTPSDAVPYAFEKRIMALLPVRAPVDAMALWARALWRAAVSCVVIMILCSAWSIFSPDSSTTLADDFETTIVAGLNDLQVW
jgi:hypothetical protein